MLHTIFMIFITALFVSNFVVINFLGVCPFLGVSKNTSSAFGMGVAVTVVMALATLVTYPLYTYILVPLGIEFLEIIFFIFIIAALVQMLEKILKRFLPSLYHSLGIYLPLITTNCAVLGVTELVIENSAMESMLSLAAGSWNLGYSLLYAVFAGVGFLLAIVVMSGLREKVELYRLPKALKGFPISMVLACFMAMAFYVFTLI